MLVHVRMLLNYTCDCNCAWIPIDEVGKIIGLYAAIAGVAAYNNTKLKKETSRGTSDEAQHSESMPLVSSSTTEK